MRRLLFAPSDAWHTLTGDRDPLEPPRGLLSVEGDFRAIGEEFLGHLVRECALTPDSAVLDVGCGPGRMAAPLTRFLASSGRYVGLDVLPDAIGWCSRAISPRFPNFAFQLADVRNSNYNPRGRFSPEAYAFPFPDGAFDVVLLASVFTHMELPAVGNYLSQCARVLRPGGRCLATFFLADEPARARRSEWRPSLAHDLGRSFVADPNVPDIAIGHREEDVRGLVERAGLTIEKTMAGSWSAAPSFVSHQDIVIAARPVVKQKLASA